MPGSAALSVSLYKTGRFSLPLTADEDVTVLGDLLLDRKTAKKLGLTLEATSAAASKKYVILTKGQVRLQGGQAGKLALRLSSSTRKKLGKARKLSVLLRLAARDAAGNEQVTRKTMTMRKPGVR